MWEMESALLVGVKTELAGMSRVYWASAAPMNVTETLDWRDEMMGPADVRVRLPRMGRRVNRVDLRESIFFLSYSFLVLLVMLMRGCDGEPGWE
jgi:hypothetical protein